MKGINHSQSNRFIFLLLSSFKLLPSQIAGKGHNETLVIVHPLENTTAATDAVDVHVPGNDGT
jgi:hypothetical protein